LFEKPQKLILELTSSHVLDFAPPENCSDRRNPSSARVPLQQPCERLGIEEPQNFSFVEGTFELVGIENSSEIKQRPRDRCYRDAVVSRDLVCFETVAVKLNSWLWAPASPGGHLDVCPRRPTDSPESGRGSVAEHGSWAGHKYCGHPSAFGRDWQVTNPRRPPAEPDAAAYA
jgi:hypothetical protein